MHYRVILVLTFTLFLHSACCLTTDEVQAKLKAATLNFLKSLQAPTCANVILTPATRQKYIADSIIGRIQPLGTFSTIDAALEYMYAPLCGPDDRLPQNIHNLKSATLLALTYDPDRYVVSYKFLFTLQSTLKFTLYGMMAFNQKLQICGFETVAQNLGITLDLPQSTHSTFIGKVCQLTQEFCRVGTSNQQYTSASECVKFLSNQLPFGSYDQADQNNVICRFVQLRYAALLPSVHCPHLGKNGGKVCTNKSYQAYYNGTTDFLKCAYQFRK